MITVVPEGYPGRFRRSGQGGVHHHQVRAWRARVHPDQPPGQTASRWRTGRSTTSSPTRRSAPTSAARPRCMSRPPITSCARATSRPSTRLRGAQVIFGPADQAATAAADDGGRGGLSCSQERLHRAGRPELLGAGKFVMSIDKALGGTGSWLDDRFHGAKGVRMLFRKVFPDHWSFMLGEIALYSFIILLLTGTFLALFFKPTMTDGHLPRLVHQARRRHMSQAYAVNAATSASISAAACSCARSTTGPPTCSWPRSLPTCSGSSSPARTASRAKSTG